MAKADLLVRIQSHTILLGLITELGTWLSPASFMPPLMYDKRQ